MKTKDLARVIRKLVREEVQREVQNLLTEKNVTKTKYSEKKNLTLTEALAATEEESYATMKTFNASDARAGFAGLQNRYTTPAAHTDINGRPVDVSQFKESGLTDALTKDYTELVKRFKK